jgi:Na+/H+-dicarboxylate symporter
VEPHGVGRFSEQIRGESPERRHASAAGGEHGSTVDFLLGVIPTSLLSALTGGEVLQTLFVPLLVGFAVQSLGARASPSCGRSATFVVVVLAALLRLTTGVSLFALLNYLGREFLLIVSTSSSETALPRLIAKMEHLGVSKPVVGITVPTGHSVNLDGTAIYLTMASPPVRRLGSGYAAVDR